MVIPTGHRLKSRGMAMAELMLAISIFLIAVAPLGYSFVSEGRLFRASYQRAVAMEIVDGEMEILAAGQWRDFPEGSHPYSVHADAAANLPRGQFQLTRNGHHLRLEWSSAIKHGVGKIVREVTVQ